MLSSCQSLSQAPYKRFKYSYLSLKSYLLFRRIVLFGSKDKYIRLYEICMKYRNSLMCLREQIGSGTMNQITSCYIPVERGLIHCRASYPFTIPTGSMVICNAHFKCKYARKLHIENCLKVVGRGIEKGFSLFLFLRGRGFK